MDPADLTIAEAGRKLRDGTLTSTALTEAHLGRVEALNGELHAFVLVAADRARADAARADAELAADVDRGLLHGIPIGIKDVIDTAGIRTASGSRLRADHVPEADAAVMTRLAEGGAVLLGKLTTYEFATVGPDFDAPSPPARNPWSFDHITGGSSSGSAAAVAAGLVRTTLGSDTAGSVRGPASYCGVVGLKPTAGLVATSGVMPLSQSLDHIGPISATVAEAAATLDVAAGLEAGKSAGRLIGRDVEGLRIGYARRWFVDDPEVMPAVVDAIDEAISVLSLLGARIEEIDLPPYDEFRRAGSDILNFESFAIHRDDLAARPDEYGRMSRLSLMTGKDLTASDVAAARTTGAALRAQVDDEVFTRVDTIVTVATLTTAFPLSAFEGGKTVWTPMRTMAFNVTGHPVLVLPAGFSDGLPIGIQIVGPSLGEAAICRVGHAFEQNTDHSAMKPPLRLPRWTTDAA